MASNTARKRAINVIKQSFLRRTDGICAFKNALQESQLFQNMMLIVGEVKEKEHSVVETEPGSLHYEDDIYLIAPTRHGHAVWIDEQY